MSVPSGRLPTRCPRRLHFCGAPAISTGLMAHPGTLQGIGGVSPQRKPDTLVVPSHVFRPRLPPAPIPTVGLRRSSAGPARGPLSAAGTDPVWFACMVMRYAIGRFHSQDVIKGKRLLHPQSYQEENIIMLIN
ncbi:hypothetical protein NDU88_004814 [Pleurodeles waltl]|uniref:Uncharacterized protein n=1 Tax=Pleurodeles waltl TaxID=8319 RepID=A0AAV7T8N7_PLEWA|nr:hypothetical protein NDU88_004814 [Pleurodeles waltl]